MTTAVFSKIESKMQEAELSSLAIEAFRRNYQQLVSGETGKIPESAIEPLESADDLEQLRKYSAEGQEALKRAVVIKLNGGLGTSMGLDRAKSLLPAKEGLSFLEIILQQIVHARREYSSAVPLLLMNSFSTEADAQEVIEKDTAFLKGQADVPYSFLQNKVPKILVEDYSAVSWPKDPDAEWCPPGHGDIYTALVQCRLLEKLVASGYQYAFVSNADNLGASLDLQVLGYFAASGSAFMMEVADRTETDKKGGHVAKKKNGGLLLREVAQCPDEDLAEFQNTAKYRYFNTNSIWLDLRALQAALQEHDGILPLPLIVNRKTVDPRDAESPAVFQLETAMGAAISVFDKATVLRVPRSRFLPVKTTNELLRLWSDAYLLTEEGKVVEDPARPVRGLDVSLDSSFYKKVDQFQARFPHGAPSMKDCRRLSVEGDVLFGKNVRLCGEVSIRNTEPEQMTIDDNTVLGD